MPSHGDIMTYGRRSVADGATHRADGTVLTKFAVLCILLLG